MDISNQSGESRVSSIERHRQNMDKYEFMCMVDDIFDECETKAQMDSRLKEMRNIIQQQYILKIGFKQTMGELK